MVMREAIYRNWMILYFFAAIWMGLCSWEAGKGKFKTPFRGAVFCIFIGLIWPLSFLCLMCLRKPK